MGLRLVMARRIAALALPSGSRWPPARLKPEARSSARRIRTTAARTRARRSSFAMVSSNCCRSWSNGSMVTTGRRPRRRQVPTVDRGMARCLGKHLMPVRRTCSRMRWSYTRRVCDAAGRVLIITKGSPAGRHPPAKTSMILRVPQMRTQRCWRSSRAAALLIGAQIE